MKEKLIEMNEQKAFELGKAKALTGANIINCHFSIFSKPEYTKAWIKGRDSVKECEEKQ